jgi:hypothetical protein
MWDTAFGVTNTVYDKASGRGTRTEQELTKISSLKFTNALFISMMNLNSSGRARIQVSHDQNKRTV